MFERVYRGSLSSLQTQLQEERIRGEYVVCIEGYHEPKVKVTRNKYPKTKVSTDLDR
jgi:16S rRNA C1402 (ribose-2'-O) methylase RsmI